jgi:hypothetical protein
MAATVLLLPVAVLGALLFVLGLSLFNAGLLRCAQRVDREERFEMSDLFFGFSYRIGAQLGAALLWVLVWLSVVALIAVAMVLAIGVPASMKDLPTLAALALGGTWLLLWLGLMVVFGVALLPLYGAQLLTPALVVLADQSPGAAVMQAIRGSYQNFLPQVVFWLVTGAAFLVLALLAALLERIGVPEGLTNAFTYFAYGIVSVCSTYLAFRDIFHTRVGD